jgi:hypothetical protein
MMKVRASSEGTRRTIIIDDRTKEAFLKIQETLRARLGLEVYPTAILRRAIQDYCNRLQKNPTLSTKEVTNLLNSAAGFGNIGSEKSNDQRV